MNLKSISKIQSRACCRIHNERIKPKSNLQSNNIKMKYILIEPNCKLRSI